VLTPAPVPTPVAAPAPVVVPASDEVATTAYQAYVRHCLNNRRFASDTLLMAFGR
jgi:hypothetical protein